MCEEEILKLWKQGLSKHMVAKIYQRRYNQQMKRIRLDPKVKDAKFISQYEALHKIESVIIQALKKQGNPL